MNALSTEVAGYTLKTLLAMHYGSSLTGDSSHYGITRGITQVTFSHDDGVHTGTIAAFSYRGDVVVAVGGELLDVAPDKVLHAEVI